MGDFFSGPTKDMNFKLCMQTTCWKVDAHNFFSNFWYFFRNYDKLDFFLRKHDFLGSTNGPNFKLSMWWEVNEYIFSFNFFYFSQKYAKFNAFVDAYSHPLPSYNLRTPVISSCLTCVRTNKISRHYVSVVLEQKSQC